MSNTAPSFPNGKGGVTLYDSRGRVVQQIGSPGESTTSVYDLDDSTADEGGEPPEAGIKNDLLGEHVE